MPAATARLQTPHAARYLGQLCKHFAHKVAVDWEEGASTGRIAFSVGTAHLQADAAALTLRAEAPDAAGLAQVESVLWSHLERFAFREAPQAPAWGEWS